MYPDWVEKYHVEGTSIRKTNDNYYLYKVTSKRVPDKSYPVCIKKYVGKITEQGLLEPQKISFLPDVDKLSLLSDKIENITASDKKILDKVAVIDTGDIFYCGKITEKEKKVIIKYFNYENGKIWR